MDEDVSNNKKIVVSTNLTFFDTVLNLFKNDNYSGSLQIDIIDGAMTQQPTDCGVGEEKCTVVDHRSKGWYIQFHNSNKGTSDIDQRKVWMEDARNKLIPFGGGSKPTAYQNYQSDLIPRGEWKEQYFPGRMSNNMTTYEFLQKIKCQYNPHNAFGQERTENFEIEVDQKICKAFE